MTALVRHAFAALVFVSTTSIAQEDCSKALVPDVSDVKSDVTTFVSYLDIINQSNFEAMKKDSSFGLSFEIYGIPFDVSTNYSKFSEARSAFFQKVGYTSRSRDATTYLFTKVSQAAFESYSQCLRYNAYQRIGPHIIPTAITSQTAVFQVLWIAPPGKTKGKPAWSYKGLTPLAAMPPSFDSNGSYTVAFTRSTGSVDAALTINVEGGGDAFVLAYVPPPPPPVPPPEAKTVDVRKYRTEGPDRQVLSLSCPDKYKTIPTSVVCNSSVPGVTVTSLTPISDIGYTCQFNRWAEVGIALDLRFSCEHR